MTIAIAHRGNSSEAPANTLEAIQQAIDIGVDMIEVDVRLSKDGVPVLIHDAELDQTTNGKGAVSSLTLEELKQLDAGSWKDKRYFNERIPTLMEALDLVKGKAYLSLDLKDEGAIPAMLRTIQEAQMIDNVVICGCYEPQARAIWSISKDVTVLLNIDENLDALFESGNTEQFINQYIRRACRERFAGLNVNFKYITEELIYRAHLRALPVWAWTVDDESDMQKLIGLSVDAIYTNYPKRLLSVLRNSKLQ